MIRFLLIFVCAWFNLVLCSGQPLVMAKHDGFTSYYDLYRCNPALVVWHLAYKDFSGAQKPKSRRFKTDTKLPPPRVKDSDLTKTGFVRGHLCPAADRDSDRGLLKETYLTSNMTPQTMVCNSGAWRMLEDTCRVIAKSHGELIVGAGCLYPDENLGVLKVGRIWVPCAFYRIARCTVHPSEIWAWIVQNSQTDSRPVRVSVSVLEKVLQAYPDTASASVTISCAYKQNCHDSGTQVISLLKVHRLID